MRDSTIIDFTVTLSDVGYCCHGNRISIPPAECTEAKRKRERDSRERPGLSAVSGRAGLRTSVTNY